MSDDAHNTGMSRRDFIRTVGLGSVAATGLSAAGALAAAPADDKAAKNATMPKRKLGKTGVEVPILCLGGMFDTINNQRLLAQAISWGVTYWDTAEVYGNGLSEEGFGRYFSRNPEARKDIFLATKLITKGGNWPERFGKCLERLKTNYVDLFYLHAAYSFSDLEPANLEFAEKMKKEGKIKFFGLSTHNNMEDIMLAAAKTKGVDVIMTSYNFRLMQTQKMKEAVAACTEAGIGLVAMKTMGMGPDRKENDAEFKLNEAMLSRGFSIEQGKLKAVWEDKNFASICSQMPTLTILSANVAASRDLSALADGELGLMRELAACSKGDYCAGCGSICFDAVDGAAPISEVMRALMYYHEYGEPGLAKSTFAALPEAVRASLAGLDYATAEAKCPQGLAIAGLMRQAVDLLA